MKWWDQMPWSSFSECWALSQLFHSPLSLSKSCHSTRPASPLWNPPSLLQVEVFPFLHHKALWFVCLLVPLDIILFLCVGCLSRAWPHRVDTQSLMHGERSMDTFLTRRMRTRDQGPHSVGTNRKISDSVGMMLASDLPSHFEEVVSYLVTWAPVGISIFSVGKSLNTTKF